MDTEGTPWLLTLVSTYGYLALFSVLFLEELGVPLPLPGDVALIFAGYLVGRGVLRFDLAVLIVVLAAVSGSSALYLLSRRYGRVLLILYGRYVRLDERRLEWIESRFRRFGPWAVPVARVTPGLRIYTSILAGLGEVPYPRFAVAVAPSALIWAISFVAIGTLIGEGWKQLAVLFEHHAVWAAVFVLPLLLLGILIWWWHKRWAQRMAHQ